MQNELTQLGDLLKQKRKERNLSLKEVENGTSIRISFLEAIEDGQLNKLISPIYAQGFIKKYAFFLGLDGEKLLRERPFLMKILSDRQVDPQTFAYGLGSIEIRGSPGGEIKWMPNLVWVGVSVLVILTGWFIARYFGIF